MVGKGGSENGIGEARSATTGSTAGAPFPHDLPAFFVYQCYYSEAISCVPESHHHFGRHDHGRQYYCVS